MFKHLKNVNKSYFSHLFFAWQTAIQLTLAAFCLFVHGLFPDVFQHTASTIVEFIHLNFKNIIKDSKQ